MKELATQRAKQLQKEEEERNREQKAKALAKLEELNRRTSEESQNQKLECDYVEQKQEEHLGASSSKTLTGIGGEAPDLSGQDSDAAIEVSENVLKIKESVESSLNKPLEDSLNHAGKGLAVEVDQSVHLTSDAISTEIAAEKTVSQFPDGRGQKQKQTGYKRKQNTSYEKTLPVKMAPSGITTVQDDMDGITNVTSAESGVPSNANAKDDHPQQQHKKKNNRVAKNKQKADEPLPISTLPPSEPTEGCSAKALTETKKTATLETASAAGSVKAETSRAVVKAGESQDEGLVSAEHGWSQSAEDAHARTTGHWKAQPHRRVSRNTQSIRPVEKFHGNEGTIWAPVRTLVNKSEPLEESKLNVNMNSGHSLGKNGHGMQSSLTRGKRAEIERYVPKPAAKELSHQENSQVDSALVEAIKSGHGSQGMKNSGQDHSADGKTGLAVEAKSAEVKQNKDGKMHASWRQRSPVESSATLQNPQEGPTSSSDPSKIMHMPADQQHIPKADFPTQKDHEKHSDGLNMDPVPQGEITAPIVVKDYGGAGRGKRQRSRAQRNSGHSHSLGDRKDAEETLDKIGNQPITFGSIEMDARSNAGNENQAKVDHASTHWQPKPQAHSTQNRQGRRGNGSQRQFHEKEYSHIPAKMDKDATAQGQPDGHKASVELNDPHHQEAKRETKGAFSAKEQTNTPNRVPPRSTEVILENVDNYHGEPASMGIRRQGQHGGRFNRGQEAPYGGGRGNSVQDKQQIPTNGDRRKHGSHYEYQPVGSYNRPDSSFHQEEVHERSQGTSTRYRERVQNHPRRGGQFYGRNSGGSAVCLATTYDNED